MAKAMRRSRTRAPKEPPPETASITMGTKVGWVSPLAKSGSPTLTPNRQSPHEAATAGREAAGASPRPRCRPARRRSSVRTLRKRPPLDRLGPVQDPQGRQTPPALRLPGRSRLRRHRSGPRSESGTRRSRWCTRPLRTRSLETTTQTVFYWQTGGSTPGPASLLIALVISSTDPTRR